MSNDEAVSIKAFKATVTFSAYSFEEAADELRRDGYAIESLSIVESA